MQSSEFVAEIPQTGCSVAVGPGRMRRARAVEFDATLRLVE